MNQFSLYSTDGNSFSVFEGVSSFPDPIINRIECPYYIVYYHHLSICIIETTTELPCASHDYVYYVTCRKSKYM